MPTTTYSTNAGRINEIKGEILAHALPVEVLAMGCKQKPMPKNMGDNITYRRYIPFGATTTNANTQNRPSVTASAHILAEGVTPAADTLTPVDVNVQLQQYACLYSYTDKTEDLYEDDLPEEMKIQTGERMGLVREMIRYGSLKAATNVSYAGGTSRMTVDEAISLNILRRMTKTLKANHAKKKTRIITPSPLYDTSAIQPSYCVFVHTDAQPDIEDLPDYVPASKYGSRQAINEHEIGSVGEYRFMLSPELAPYLAGGAVVGATGLVSAGAANVDVYPFIVMGEEAAFDVALRGGNSFDVKHIPAKQADKSDPLAQRGYVGAKFWDAVLVTNNGWMGVIEAGVTDV